ncbi:MAG: hypothetical protein WD598_12215 [Acidimicrobiia bacterium]
MRSIRRAVTAAVLTWLLAAGAVPVAAGEQAPVPYVSGAGKLIVERAPGDWSVVADDVWGVSPLSFENHYFAEVSNGVCAADQSGLIAVARVDALTGTRELLGDGGNPMLSWDGRHLAYTGIDCESVSNQRQFRLVIRDVVTGVEVDFATPVGESSEGPGGWVEPVSWAADSRHLVVQVGSIGPPGISPEFWYLDARSTELAFVGHRLPQLDHGRGPYGLAALGTSGEWVAVVSAKGGKGPVRIVTYDVERATSDRVLGRVPAAKERGAAALIRILSDPAGSALLMLVGEENFASSLYELDVATEKTRLLYGPDAVHAGWLIPASS